MVGEDPSSAEWFTDVGVQFREGPVLMTQLLALSDSAFVGIGSGCHGHIIAGAFLLLLGPLAFVGMAALRIAHHVVTGDMAYQVKRLPFTHHCCHAFFCTFCHAFLFFFSKTAMARLLVYLLPVFI